MPATRVSGAPGGALMDTANRCDTGVSAHRTGWRKSAETGVRGRRRQSLQGQAECRAPMPCGETAAPASNGVGIDRTGAGPPAHSAPADGSGHFLPPLGHELHAVARDVFNTTCSQHGESRECKIFTVSRHGPTAVPLPSLHPRHRPLRCRRRRRRRPPPGEPQHAAGAEAATPAGLPRPESCRTESWRCRRCRPATAPQRHPPAPAQRQAPAPARAGRQAAAARRAAAGPAAEWCNGGTHARLAVTATNKSGGYSKLRSTIFCRAHRSQTFAHHPERRHARLRPRVQQAAGERADRQQQARVGREAQRQRQRQCGGQRPQHVQEESPAGRQGEGGRRGGQPFSKLVQRLTSRCAATHPLCIIAPLQPTIATPSAAAGLLQPHSPHLN